MNQLDKMIDAGDVSRDQVMEAALRFLREWEPLPRAASFPAEREMTLRTRRPGDWILLDTVSGKRYRWANGWILIK